MLRLFKETKIDFVGFQKVAIIFSILLTVLTFVSIGYHRVVDKMLFNWSIEFVGGTLVQVKFTKPVENEVQKIRDIMSQKGYSGSEIKKIGKEEDNELLIIVRKHAEAAALGNEIRSVL